MIIIWETGWKRAGRNWFKIRADSNQLATISPCFLVCFVLASAIYMFSLSSLPLNPFSLIFCHLPSSSAPWLSVKHFFQGWSFVLVWFQVIPGADDKFNSTRKQSAGAQFRVWYCCPEVCREMKALIILSLQKSWVKQTLCRQGFSWLLSRADHSGVGPVVARTQEVAVGWEISSCCRILHIWQCFGLMDCWCSFALASIPWWCSWRGCILRTHTLCAA